jgi:hypothetical protein
MASSLRTGPAGSPAGKPSPFADRRIIILIALVVGVVGFYGFQSWRVGAERAVIRSKLLMATASELAEETPDRDALSKLMARIRRLSDSSVSVELLALQAEIELVRGRPDRADVLFGSIASSPDALPADLRLGSRILLAKHAGFGGEVVEANTMLQQVQSMAEAAYGDSRDVKDLFRAWQASIRLWDSRAADFAKQLKANHGEAPESRLAQLNEHFVAQRDQQLVADLLIDFTKVPAELRAIQTIVTLQGGDVPSARKDAEQHVIETPGVPGVRLVAAVVLHACAVGSAPESADRAVFVKRRNVHLDWLDKRAPADQEKKWDAMRQVR